jgi:ABC-type thiamine transport system ATPase subunit
VHPTIYAARRRRHLSRHERQRLARAEAFSRRTPPILADVPPAKLETRELELIDRLVRHDRTAVSSAVLAIAGIGGGQALRRVVLAHVGEAACWAEAEGAISAERGAQIARHVERALGRGSQALAA